MVAQAHRHQFLEQQQIMLAAAVGVVTLLAAEQEAQEVQEVAVRAQL
jgi:hypothetical protein